MAIGEALIALKGDNDITPEDITPEKLGDLKLEIESCTPEQSDECIAILDAAIGRAQGDAIAGLQGLRDNIEVSGPVEYSIDGLIEHVSEDEKAKAFLELYKSVIANDLATIYGEKYNTLTEPAKNTIELVFWNLIQSQLGISGAINMGQGIIGSLTEGFTGMFGEAEEEATGSILTESLRNKEDFFNTLEGAPGISASLTEDVSQVIDIVESLIGKEADNLNVLLEATKDMGETERAQIFENPLIIQAVMNNGKYRDNNFNINLTSSPISIELGDAQNLEEIQSSFLEEMKEDTSSLGGKLDRMRDLKERADGFLGKFGIDGGLDGLFETLYKVPVLGVFFKMIFGDFFDGFDSLQGTEAVGRVIESLGNIPAGMSLKSLRDTFLPKFTEKYPGKEETAIGKLFKNTPPLSEGFYTSLTGENNFFANMTEAEVPFGNSNFWDQVFMGEGTTPQTEIIHNRLLSLRILENVDVTEEQIIAALNSLTVEELTIVETTGEEPLPPVGGKAPEETILPEITNFDDAVSFPFLFEGTQISYDLSNFDLKVGDDSFHITNIGDEEMNAAKIGVVSPILELQEENIMIEYTAEFGGPRNTVSINRGTFSDFLREIIAGESAILSIPHEDPTKGAIDILFTKIA